MNWRHINYHFVLIFSVLFSERIALFAMINMNIFKRKILPEWHKCFFLIFQGEKIGEYVCMQRVHLLMNFMEHLEKLLYNAYEGCAVAMPPVHKVRYILFFFPVWLTALHRQTACKFLYYSLFSISSASFFVFVTLYSAFISLAVLTFFHLMRSVKTSCYINNEIKALLVPIG